MHGLRLLLLLACCLLLLPAQALEPSQVVVVYNADSTISRQSAQRYALLRGIPPEQVVALTGVRGGGISRQDFDDKVRTPLLQLGFERGWRWPAGSPHGSKRILAMVMMPELPLRIGGSPRPEGAPALKPLQEDCAAVDSELMLLGAQHPIAGALVNPCYDKNVSLGRDLPPVLMVCRIDGPDVACINRMIEDPIRVEREGLWGWTVVDQGGPFKRGDEWMAEIATQARLHSQPLFHETSRATLAEAFPLMLDTAVYFGWYTSPANGPFRPDTPGGFRFAPGAVAVHLHSFSASTVTDANNWVGALLTRGAAVTAGNVFEPYLATSLHFDIFFNRLLKGYCVAEAALMATPCTSWQCIVLGDPLYRPYAAKASSRQNNAYTLWRRLCHDSGGDLAELARAVRDRLQQPEGPALAEMLAWYCTEEKKLAEATEFFSAACGGYRELRDRTRTAIMAASVMAADKKKERALSVLSSWIGANPNSPYLPALLASYKALGGKLPGDKK